MTLCYYVAALRDRDSEQIVVKIVHYQIQNGQL